MKSIFRFSIIALVFSYSVARSQNVEIITDDQTRSAYENKSYLVVKSLRLLPGFQFSSASGTFYAKVAPGVTPSTSPSIDQNFVKEEVMLTSGITNDAQATAAGVSSKSTIYEYFDDAGRRIQQVSVGANPSISDIVTPQYYDALGRPTRRYLPYISGNSGAYHSSFTSEETSFYATPPAKVISDTKPYKDVSFDNSPLNRITQVIPEGSAWTSSNSVKTVIKFNASGTVRQWTISGSLPVSSSTYSEGSLKIQETTNEENKVHREYTDFRGLTILVEDQLPGGQTAQTYYVHNLYGAVVFIIPPRASAIYSPVQADADKWYYQYEYDQYQRVIGTKAPGVAWKYTIYDKWDRVVLTQDGNQRANSQWEFMKYDDLNRLILTGIYTTSDSRTTLTTNAGSASGRYESIAANFVDYTLNASFPTTVTSADLRTMIFYDNYTFLNYSNWDAENKVFTFVSEPGFTGTYLSTIKDKATGSKVRVLGTNQWLNSVTYYDSKYRAIQTISENHFGQLDRFTREYDFTGKVTKTVKVHVNSEPETITIKQRFTYDHSGRLLDTYHQVQSQPEVLLARIEYNALGQPIDKKLHSGDNGTSWLQSIDYRYNIRGWKTNINNTSADAGDPTDLYGQDMAYNTSQSGNTPRYDGLITGARWKHDLGTRDRIYNLNYDKGMLTSANYKVDGGIIPQTNIYTEDGITYDLNGNIRTLQRRSGSTTATVTDSLTYHYGAAGNQLLYVKDASGSNTGFADLNTGNDDYAYDANGNLIKDKNKGIDRSGGQGIIYNERNLPQQINLPNNRYIVLQYDAVGKKLNQVLYDGTTVPATQLRRIDYVGEFVYIDSKPDFISHAAGRLVPASNNNLITDVSTREATSTTGYTTINSVTATALTAAGQTYVNVVSNQASGTPGIVSIGGDINVNPDESYVFKILGYQSVGTTAALYVRNATSGAALSIPVTPLPVGSAAQNWISVRFVIPHTGVTKINVGVLFNTPANNDAFRINRVALYKGDWEYQYFLKDHLGSPRVVLQTAPTTWTYTATMESANYTNENEQFLRLQSPKEIAFSAANHTPGGGYAYKMSAADSIGPARTFKVLPGDVVDASVWSYYPSGATYNKAGVTAMSTAVIAALAGGSTLLGSGIDQAYSNSGATGSHPLWMLSQDQTSSKPSAFINYILFDETYTPLEAKSVPVGSADALTQIALPTINIQQTGYLMVYLSYDDTNNDAAHEVYFDDLQIVYHESNVIQINSYYAFGMPAFSWIRDGENENRYLFQEKEMISEVAWQDFGSRMYDSQLGRWFAADPANQFMSPYLALGNDPFNSIDPNGEKVDWKKIGLIAAAIAVAIITDGLAEEFLAPALIDAFSMTEAAGAITAGAIGGAVSGAIGGGLLSENNFGSNAFWHDVAVGSFAGAVGGGIGGALGEAAEGATAWEKVGQAVENGAIQGAGGGFAYGIASGVNEGGHDFWEDLKMGLTGAITGAEVGAITGAVEEMIGTAVEDIKERLPEHNEKSNASKAGKIIDNNKKTVYDANKKASMYARSAGASKPSASSLFFTKIYHGNWIGSIMKEVSDHSLDAPKETANERLNRKWWGITKDEGDEGDD